MEEITSPSAGKIVKSDRTGRTRYTAEYKREALDAFESSSLSAPAFAKSCGVKYPTFAAWIAKRKKPCSGVPACRPAFVLAEMPAPASAGCLEVCFPGGAVVRAAADTQLDLLARLLRKLA